MPAPPVASRPARRNLPLLLLQSRERLLARFRPVLNTHGITEWDKLPAAARAYLRALEELAGCPLSIVSTGPDRDHTMVLQDPFA